MQRAPDDVGVRDVVGDRADRRQHAAPARAAHRDAAIRVEEARGERAVALDQEAVEAEDLHFLRRLGAGAGLPHVVELAPLGRAGEVERIALRVEVRLADERGQERDGEQHDEPRRVDEEPRGEAHDGDDVLRLAEELADEARAARGLAPRALQPVLQLAVLEVLEVERGRVLHEPQARLVAELLGQQRIEQRDEAAEHVGGDREPELQREQPADAVELAAREPLPQRVVDERRAREPHDLVDDELADVERHDRQQRAHDAQHALAHRQRGARPPDELQEGRKVAQRAQALAEAPALEGDGGSSPGRAEGARPPIAYFFGMAHCAAVRHGRCEPRARLPVTPSASPPAN